jgi:hypothetical protein
VKPGPGSDLERVFGGAGRVRMLGVLANSSTPLSAYRIAKIALVQPIKGTLELRRLRDAGLVNELPGERGGSRWVLTDADLRAFFRRRVRILPWAEVRAGAEDRAARGRALLDRIRPMDFSKYRSSPEVGTRRQDFSRRPGKDAELARLGLRTRAAARKKRRR